MVAWKDLRGLECYLDRTDRIDRRLAERIPCVMYRVSFFADGGLHWRFVWGYSALAD